MSDHKPVTIDWLDTQSDPKWTDAAGLPSPKHCRTRGYLVMDTPEYIVVSGSIQLGHDDGEPFSDSTAIPRGCIERILMDKEET